MCSSLVYMNVTLMNLLFIIIIIIIIIVSTYIVIVILVIEHEWDPVLSLIITRAKQNWTT